MDQRLTLITLGVTDLDRSLSFYRRGLGWRLCSASGGDFAMFLLNGGIALALYPRKLLASDAGLADRAGFGGVTLAQNVETRAEVDRVLEHAARCGGRILKAATEKEWGGYSGYFSDPDGHPWEIAWNPLFRLRDGLLDMEG